MWVEIHLLNLTKSTGISALDSEPGWKFANGYRKYTNYTITAALRLPCRNPSEYWTIAKWCISKFHLDYLQICIFVIIWNPLHLQTPQIPTFCHLMDHFVEDRQNLWFLSYHLILTNSDARFCLMLHYPWSSRRMCSPLRVETVIHYDSRLYVCVRRSPYLRSLGFCLMVSVLSAEEISQRGSFVRLIFYWLPHVKEMSCEPCASFVSSFFFIDFIVVWMWWI